MPQTVFTHPAACKFHYPSPSMLSHSLSCSMSKQSLSRSMLSNSVTFSTLRFVFHAFVSSQQALSVLSHASDLPQSFRVHRSAFAFIVRPPHRCCPPYVSDRPVWLTFGQLTSPLVVSFVHPRASLRRSEEPFDVRRTPSKTLLSPASLNAAPWRTQTCHQVDTQAPS